MARGLELKGSLGPDVRALLVGGAVRDGLGCGEEGGVGLTLVWYFLGAGAAAEESTAALP